MIIYAKDEGYSINLCECRVPHLGARRAGTPCCCEVCGFMTRDQWNSLLAGQMERMANLLITVQEVKPLGFIME